MTAPRLDGALRIGRDWELVIVGAGPAGSAAAIRACSLGIRTLLVDRASFPRSKVCGCCLSPEGLRALDGLGLGAQVRGAGKSIAALELCALGRSARIDIGAGALAVSRDRLDEILVRAAQARGACVIEGVRASLAGHEQSGSTLVLNTSDSTVELRARHVIVADGLGGTFLPRSPGWEPDVAPGGRMGLGARLAASTNGLPRCGDAGTVLMCCGRGGYAGIVGLEDGTIDVAAAIDPAMVRESGGPGNAVARIVREATGASIDARAALRWQGTPILTRSRPVDHGTLIVAGDAAGYVEPFTGEGISWAIRSGAAAADHVRAMMDGRAGHGAWGRTYGALFGARHRACGRVSRLLRSPGMVSVLGPLVACSPSARAMAVGLLARSWRAEGHAENAA